MLNNNDKEITVVKEFSRIWVDNYANSIIKENHNIKLNKKIKVAGGNNVRIN